MAISPAASHFLRKNGGENWDDLPWIYHVPRVDDGFSGEFWETFMGEWENEP